MNLINKVLKPLNFKLGRLSKSGYQNDFNEPEFKRLYDFCSPYTMTSQQKMYSLFCSMQYIIEHGIEGDFVECGVWKGGSTMLIASYLKEHNITNRKIYLYDTFEGMAEPGDHDIDLHGEKAITTYSKMSTGENKSEWAYAGLMEVKENMQKTGFSDDNLIYVEGMVEDTIPKTVPERIALLRLDTDWYESTKHELEHLYPLLITKGVLILDDFGHWGGAKKATLEYFEKRKEAILLSRIDYSARTAIKTSSN